MWNGSSNKAAFDAAARAASIAVVPDANPDLFTSTVGGGTGCRVEALSMAGLAYLVRDLGLVPDAVDVLMLLCNIQAAATGRLTAWPQK
jgi:hypothetical protein